MTVIQSGQVVHTPVSLTKRYNRVMANGCRSTAAGKVTSVLQTFMVYPPDVSRPGKGMCYAALKLSTANVTFWFLFSCVPGAVSYRAHKLTRRAFSRAHTSATNLDLWPFKISSPRLLWPRLWLMKFGDISTVCVCWDRHISYQLW